MIYDTYPDLAIPTGSGEEIHSVWEQDNNVIDHVIFVIHGIGQQTERFGYFEQHMETIRSTICEVLQARMPYRDIRIQLIPIEWHKHIHEQTDESLNNISLKNIPGMRLVGNDYIMDGLYYLAKDRQQTIITHVTRTFNEAYHEFIDSHPTFQGNIGIFGYSLGGLITWDILAHQRSITTMEEQAQLDKLDLNVPHLDFKPQFLFGVGCPLGAFLNIRNQDPKLYCPDSSTVFENIYHPCDPLAYRVEPLYHPECRHHDSVQVESAIPNDASTPIFSSLTDWVTSWFKRSNEKLQDDIQVSSTPQSPVNGLNSIATTTSTSPWTPPQTPTLVKDSMSLIATTTSNSNNLHYNNGNHPHYSSPPAPHMRGNNVLDSNDDNNMESKSSESNDRTTLLSSVGALFQYISPRASFDRDSALGSDIEEDHEEEDDENNDTTFLNPLDTGCSSSSLFNKRNTKKKSSIKASNMPPVSQLSMPTMNDPNMLYRRRQSQIYDSPQSWMMEKKKRRQSLPNLHRSPRISSLEEDTMLLQSLPGSRRVDYALQPGPMFGGMISNQYLLGLQAHFSYWNNKDMLWHMVDQLDNAIH